MGFQVLSDGGFGVVSGSPRTIRISAFRKILYYCVKHYTVTPHGGERGIDFEFGQNMIVGVVAVETDKNSFVARCYLFAQRCRKSTKRPTSR